MNHPKYRPDIDGLRAVAILAVIIFHAFPALLPGGFIGVDIFFVISGYLISTIIFSNLAGDKFSFSKFYARRVRRIFPALFVVLTTFFVIGWFTLFGDEFQHFGKHLLAGSFFFSNFALLQEVGYFDTAAETKPLLHLWSLAIEEQFYIVWPLLMVLLWRIPRSIPWIVAGLFLLSFSYNIGTVNSHPSLAFYLPFSRFWELLSGSLLALYLYRRPPDARLLQSASSLLASALGLLLLIAPMFLASNRIPFPGWLALLPVAGACLVIIAGPATALNRWVLSNRVAIWIGLISYPLYLWHWPILTFALIYGVGENATSTRLMLLLLSGALAWVTYYWVEKPVRLSARPFIATRGLVLLILATGVAGYTTFDQGGFRNRDFNKNAVKIHSNWNSSTRSGQCFIETKNGPQAFATHCGSLHGDQRELPLVVLWGDSHAASLFPGLQHHARHNAFDIAQFNANGCPPVADFTAHKSEFLCPAINEHVIHFINSAKPDLIILSAYWGLYNGKDAWNELEMARLQQSIRLFTEQAIPVIVIGQLPVANISQPHIAARIFRPHEVNRTTNYFASAQFSERAKLEQAVRSAGASFTAPADVLCNDEGCMLSTSESELKPIAWDYGHLTQEGAIMLLEKLLQRGELNLPSRVRNIRGVRTN